MNSRYEETKLREIALQLKLDKITNVLESGMNATQKVEYIKKITEEK